MAGSNPKGLIDDVGNRAETARRAVRYFINRVLRGAEYLEAAQTLEQELLAW
jgi:hypothetical protein